MKDRDFTSQRVLVFSEWTAYVSHPCDADGWRHWITWVERHGIDPHEVTTTSFLRRFPERRQVTYERNRRDDKGHLMVEGNTTLRETVVVQLESPAAAMAGGVVKHDARCEIGPTAWGQRLDCRCATRTYLRDATDDERAAYEAAAAETPTKTSHVLNVSEMGWRGR